MNKSHKRLWIALIVIAAIIVAATSAFFVYTGIYYHADRDAVDAYLAGVEGYDRQDGANGSLVFRPTGEIKAGIVFYPGGKVEHTSYAPLMAALAARGYLAVLLQVPFRLAVLKPNAADGVKERYPEVTTWYVGGHSLGGSMAADYLSKHDGYAGLILLGSYTAADLGKSKLRVLSVYGSEDRVLDRDKYQAALSKYPSTFEEHVLPGGCHAYFGMYGRQKWDGEPTLDNAQQIEDTADIVAAWAG